MPQSWIEKVSSVPASEDGIEVVESWIALHPQEVRKVMDLLWWRIDVLDIWADKAWTACGGR